MPCGSERAKSPITTSHKKKRHGCVLAGDGAKAFYEAGVIRAFHIAGMEFDMVTGSSTCAFHPYHCYRGECRSRP
jgi:predicted patatin/cPLA2 family phospholipase